MGFAALLDWLGSMTPDMRENTSGPIEVKCFGLDAKSGVAAAGAS